MLPPTRVMELPAPPDLLFDVAWQQVPIILLLP
jgi:hypothetical protein